MSAGTLKRTTQIYQSLSNMSSSHRIGWRTWSGFWIFNSPAWYTARCMRKRLLAVSSFALLAIFYFVKLYLTRRVRSLQGLFARIFVVMMVEKERFFFSFFIIYSTIMILSSGTNDHRGSLSMPQLPEKKIAALYPWLHPSRNITMLNKPSHSF